MTIRYKPLITGLLFTVLCVSCDNNDTGRHEEKSQEKPPIQFITIHGTFMVPRQFAPIDVWRTMRHEPYSTNYFTTRVPADYLSTRIDGYAANLNFVIQDMLVVVEALTPDRRNERRADLREVCITADHDLEPRSVPYKRCEYQDLIDEHFAVEFWLNGDNTQFVEETRRLVRTLLSQWKLQG
ncbi:MAG: hypothetical protein HUJ31_12960 [Pseudomonadales bacterium]|nr:hypothetical protein [Pseudomonadales bacterium]